MITGMIGKIAMFAAVVFCWMTGRAQDDRTTPAFGGGERLDYTVS